MKIHYAYFLMLRYPLLSKIDRMDNKNKKKLDCIFDGFYYRKQHFSSYILYVATKMEQCLSKALRGAWRAYRSFFFDLVDLKKCLPSAYYVV